MMKYPFIIAFFLLSFVPVYASHISGGEIYYRYVGPGTIAGTDKYIITLRLFKDKNISGNTVANMPTQVTLGIFRKISPISYAEYSIVFPVKQNRLVDINITPSAYPCIIPAPKITYEVGYFEYTVDLPKEALGYMVAFQTCCRANGITNMETFPVGTGSFGDGATYVATISGTNILGNQNNSGPQFLLKDTAVVCANNRFELDFGAIDPDADSLSYSFCSAYDRGSSKDSDIEHVPSSPPYNFITYTPGFSGSQPLGNNVTIDPKTGLITGIAPQQGKYVINVCIDEWRNQQKIGEHRKDFILEVKSCDIAGADLNTGYITCDGYNLTFENLAKSPLVKSWYWDFGVVGTDTDFSTDEKPTFTFPAAGEYTVKLIVNKNDQCIDSVTTIAKIYPGFFPDFNVLGSCILKDFRFVDNSTTLHGVINKWRWKFGDETTTADVSSAPNPIWKYSTTGFKQVEAIIESSMGCIDTIPAIVEVRDKPIITMPFRDTLICSQDTLILSASGLGTYSWTPDVTGVTRFNNTPNPEVFPKTTTTFKITMDDDGCVNTDSVKVRVVDFVTLDAGADKVICLTDPVMLTPSGDGLYFKWTPALTLNDPTQRNPIATPTEESTIYTVIATISKKCMAQDQITVRTVPYPVAYAGKDTIICYDDTARLSGTVDGIRMEWSPANNIDDPYSLTPYVFPLNTTNYVLSTWDNKGCPKPGRDTVKVTVRPEILANAGRDTAVVVGQPLLLNGTGSDFYTWTPAFGLSSTNVFNPTAQLSDDFSYIMKAFTAEGCHAYDTINIKVFKTAPDIFVPNAFTPGRASNALFRPIPVGINKLDFFRVYNRWGQLMYSGTSNISGWNGQYGGKEQTQGTYVWMAKGTDYTGKSIFRKGTVVLIR